MAITRGNTEGLLPKRVKVSGSFGMQAPLRAAGEKAKAYYEFPIASGANIVVEADEGGTPGNSLDFQATADGTAKASLDLGAVTTKIDTVIEAATGGTGGNALRVFIIAGAGAKAGNLYEDTTAGYAVFALQHGVSDVNDFETLVAASTDFAVKTGGTGANVFDQVTDLVDSETLAGGTAATWAAATVGAVSGAHLHYTDAVTTCDQAVAAINATSTTLTARAVDNTGGAHALAAGDAVAKQDLANGAQTNDVLGEGFQVQKTGTCIYTVTLEDTYADMENALTTLSLNTATDRGVVGGGYDSTNKTIDITIHDTSDAGVGAADSAVHANNRISFELLMKNTN